MWFETSDNKKNSKRKENFFQVMAKTGEIEIKGKKNLTSDMNRKFIKLLLRKENELHRWSLLNANNLKLTGVF